MYMFFNYPIFCTAKCSWPYGCPYDFCLLWLTYFSLSSMIKIAWKIKVILDPKPNDIFQFLKIAKKICFEENALVLFKCANYQVSFPVPLFCHLYSLLSNCLDFFFSMCMLDFKCVKILLNHGYAIFGQASCLVTSF